MILVLIGSLALMGTAAALLARAWSMSRTRTSENLAQIDSYGFDTSRVSSGSRARRVG